MSNLLENIGNIITNLINYFGNVANALIGNEIFQIMLAVILFSLIITLLINIIKNNREMKKWNKNYSEDARRMEEEEENDFMDSIM